MVTFIKAALERARLAYQFSPNSYTNATFHAAMAVEEEFTRAVPQGHRESG